jgi:parallel beta-helix repeat protein
VRDCRFIRIGQGIHTRYASVLVEGCVFRDKHGDNDDVDLYGESDPPSMIRSNLFLYPSYDDRINPTRSSAWIVGNTIYGSSDHGIVLRDVGQPVVMNNVLYNCTAGGISVQNQCDALIVNNTLVNCNKAIKLFDHTARWGPPYCLTPGSGKATVLNCVIWNCNPAFDLADSSAGQSYVYVAYSDIEGGTSNAAIGPNSTLVVGPGNLQADPRFAGAANTNFHLLAGSPAIDAGTNQTPGGISLTNMVTRDYEGTPRPLDGDGADGAAYDLGAYEFLLAGADSNGDGIPDGWCQRYGLDPLDPTVAGADPDLDRQATLGEWVADTDPTNSLSFFQIDSVSNAPSLTVQFFGSSNRTYTLLYTTNLVAHPPGTSWTPVAGQIGVPGTGDLMILRDTNAVPPEYYRLEVKAP